MIFLKYNNNKCGGKIKGPENPFFFYFPLFFRKRSSKKKKEMMMADGGRWLTFFSLVPKVPQRISPLYRPHIHNNICPPGAREKPPLSTSPSLKKTCILQTCVILSMKEYLEFRIL
jgi:hypothetical protein